METHTFGLKLGLFLLFCGCGCWALSALLHLSGIPQASLVFLGAMLFLVGEWGALHEIGVLWHRPALDDLATALAILLLGVGLWWLNLGLAGRIFAGLVFIVGLGLSLGFLPSALRTRPAEPGSPSPRRDQAGQGLVEWALILALVAVLAILLLVFFGSQLSADFSHLLDGL